jgi:hypothetical protein
MEANRHNAKLSTGPRTESGKRNSKFNALTFGLFAKSVVIPICDGFKAEKQFRALFEELYEEFRPVGTYQEWLVMKIAESMWRLRRASRCESGAIRHTSIISGGHDSEIDIFPVIQKLVSLRRAQEQLEHSATLSRKLYSELLPIVERERQCQLQADAEDQVLAELEVNEFLSCVLERKHNLENYYDSLLRVRADKEEAQSDFEALPPEAEIQRIFRYEERMLRQIDWAMERLLQHQGRGQANV